MGFVEVYILNMFFVVVILLIICDVVFVGKKMLICGFLKIIFLKLKMKDILIRKEF